MYQLSITVTDLPTCSCSACSAMLHSSLTLVSYNIKFHYIYCSLQRVIIKLLVYLESHADQRMNYIQYWELHDFFLELFGKLLLRTCRHNDSAFILFVTSKLIIPTGLRCTTGTFPRLGLCQSRLCTPL